MTKQKTKQPRPKQQYIEGTAPPSIPEIETAADEYRECRDTRMAALEIEVAAQEKLLAIMKERCLNVYEYDGYIVKVNPVEKVSVRKKPGSNGDDDA